MRVRNGIFAICGVYFRRFSSLFCLLSLCFGQAAIAAESDKPLTPIDTVVAKVGKDEITLADVISYRQNIPPTFMNLPPEMLLENILSSLIDETLLAQEAERAGLDQRQIYLTQLQGAKRELLVRVLVNEVMQNEITDEEVHKVYDSEIVKQPAVEEIRASHILVGDEELAKKLRKSLDEGEDFAELAKEHGTDSTKSRGGDLGWFARGAMVPEFSQAAFSLADGEIGGPIKTEFGWHLIKRVESREQPKPEFEQIEQNIRSEMLARMIKKRIDALRKSVAPEIYKDLVTPEAILQDLN